MVLCGKHYSGTVTATASAIHCHTSTYSDVQYFMSCVVLKQFNECRRCKEIQIEISPPVIGCTRSKPFSE